MSIDQNEADYLEYLRALAQEEYEETIRSLGADPNDPDKLNEALSYMPNGDAYQAALKK